MPLRNKVVCFLISGKAGVGKTTSANIISEFMKDDKFICNVCSFASQLKKIARYMGWDGEKDDKGRKLLQDLGRVGREYDINMWVKALFDKIKYDNVFLPDSVVIDDWRFPNELLFVKERENLLFIPITVRIDAPNREMLKGTDLEFDVSETSLPIDNKNSYYDYFVDNSGSWGDLSVQLSKIYKEVKNGTFQES